MHAEHPSTLGRSSTLELCAMHVQARITWRRPSQATVRHGHRCNLNIANLSLRPCAPSQIAECEVSRGQRAQWSGPRAVLSVPNFHCESIQPDWATFAYFGYTPRSLSHALRSVEGLDSSSLSKRVSLGDFRHPSTALSHCCLHGLSAWHVNCVSRSFAAQAIRS